jgi:hypothetical protein
MNEEFLHYIWKFQLYNKKELILTNGELINVIRPGILNFDSGPDFFNGQVKIDSTLWAGNIEIHINSSDWLKHKHQTDGAYDKVILHVVWNADQEICRKTGEIIPCLELNGLVSKSVLDNYTGLNKDFVQVPCENEIKKVDPFIIESFLERLLVERLNVKSERFDRRFNLNKNDWESSLYQLLAKYFGFKVNAVPSELLAASLPYSIIRKHAHNLLELESLLFGQAGFLDEEFNGNYPIELKKRYKFFKHKYQLKPIDKSLWKFMRMRPVNFPTIRIAQLASLLNKHQNLFQKIVEAKNIEEIRFIFEVSGSEYWSSHFRFDVPSSKKEKRNLGKDSIDILLINTVIPLLFSYSKMRNDLGIGDRLLTYLENIKPEQNKIVKEWKVLGVSAKSAMQSQALLQLRSNYCDLKKCLNCNIGNSIIKKKAND